MVPFLFYFLALWPITPRNNGGQVRKTSLAYITFSTRLLISFREEGKKESLRKDGDGMGLHDN